MEVRLDKAWHDDFIGKGTVQDMVVGESLLQASNTANTYDPVTSGSNGLCKRLLRVNRNNALRQVDDYLLGCVLRPLVRLL